jgi:DNA-binding NarL/FixJ family response regulator
VRPDANSPEVRALVAQLVARYALTQAMAEIAIGIWYGLSEKQMATWLNKPKNTVHEHVRRLYRDQRWPEMKCRVTVALAVERELSDPPG